jgi:anti-sigma factor RsiW
MDGELDQDRNAAVERVLAENAEIADRLSEYRQRDAALRQAFDEFAAPIAISHLDRPRFPGRWTWAALVACCALLAGGLWVYTDVLNRSRDLARFVHDATSAYIL